MFLVLVEDINGDFGRAACMMPSSIKRFVAFKKTEMCKKNMYRICNVKRLEQDIKLRCNPHL